jgi:hypothetical protein
VEEEKEDGWMGACVELIDGAPAAHLHETRAGLHWVGAAFGRRGDPSMPAGPLSVSLVLCVL